MADAPAEGPAPKPPKPPRRYHPPKGVVPPQFGGTRRVAGRTLRDAALRRQLFAKQFIACKFNGKMAAIMCGYSPKNAEDQAKTLLRDPRVIAILEVEFDRLATRHDLTIDKVVMEMKALGFSNMAHYLRKEPDGSYVLDMSETTPEQLKAIAEFTVVENVIKTQEVHDAELGMVRQTVVQRRSHIKLHPKHAPLQDLLKHLKPSAGMGGEGGEGTTNIFLTQVNINAVDASKEYQAFVSGRG